MFLPCSKSRVAVFVALLFVAWLAFGGLVLAAEEGMSATEAAAASKGPVWAVAYIVILLLVGLGVFVTVRGSKRRDRAKPQDYASAVKH